MLYVIYSVIFGKHGSSVVLGILFMILAVCSLVVAGCIWGVRNQLLEYLDEKYQTELPGAEALKAVEDIFDCCGWNHLLPEEAGCDPARPPCRLEVSNFWSQNANVVGGCFLGGGFLLVLPSIIAWSWCGWLTHGPQDELASF
jgi:hypothetical protein